MDYLTTHISLSPIRRGFVPGFVIYKKGGGGTRLTPASDKVYQLLAHGRWFSPGTLASSTTKTGRHDIAEVLLKVKHQKSKSNHFIGCRLSPFIYLCCFGFISIFTICGCPTLFKHHPIVLAGKINMIFHRKP